MDRIYERRHVFLAWGIGILLFTPIFLLVFPLIIAEIFHFKDDTWKVFTTKEHYYLYGASLVAIAMACLTIFFIRVKKVAITLVSIFILTSIFLTVVAVSTFREFSDEGISFREAFSLQSYHYTWDDIEVVTYIINEDEVLESHNIWFKDGNKVNIPRNHRFIEIGYKFNEKLKEKKIPKRKED